MKKSISNFVYYTRFLNLANWDFSNLTFMLWIILIFLPLFFWTFWKQIQLFTAGNLLFKESIVVLKKK